MKRLLVVADLFDLKLKKQAVYGGDKFALPKNHQAAVVVPKGGSCCANCKYSEMQDGGPHCHNSYFMDWNNGNSRLPVDDPEAYCSDWWESK